MSRVESGNFVSKWNMSPCQLVGWANTCCVRCLLSLRVTFLVVELSLQLVTCLLQNVSRQTKCFSKHMY